MYMGVGWWECKVEHCESSALVLGSGVGVLHVEVGSDLPLEIEGQGGVGHQGQGCVGTVCDQNLECESVGLEVVVAGSGGGEVLEADSGGTEVGANGSVGTLGGTGYIEPDAVDFGSLRKRNGSGSGL